jgi:hypothetical protein
MFALLLGGISGLAMTQKGQAAPAGPNHPSGACAATFTDTFSDPATGWLVEDTADYSTAYLSGEYQILVKSTNYMAYERMDLSVSNYQVEVDARPVTHLDGNLGMTFGETASGFYLFQISNGGYGLWRIANAGWSWTTLIDWTNSDAIKTGFQTNRLKVIRIGSHIALYANGQFLTATSDSTYTGSMLGLEAATGSANFDGRFDNFTVYTGSCIGTFPGEYIMYLPYINK